MEISLMQFATFQVSRIAKIAFLAIQTILVLGFCILVLIYGKEVIPDLRPCTTMTMGCPADAPNGSCEAGLWSLRPTFCSGR
jgi:hypothetical protein